MRILKRHIDREGNGEVKFQADEPEDMYSLYNLVCPGDVIVATTTRNVVHERKTGSVEKTKVKMKLTLEVTQVEFDVEQCSLRVAGKNCEEHEYVKMGQQHTVELVVGYQYSLRKTNWDDFYLDILQEAANPSNNAEIAAITIQEGLANICLLKPTLTVTAARIEHNIPKRSQLKNGRDKATDAFFKELYEGVSKHVRFDIVKAVIVGSPGFWGEDFLRFFFEEATRRGDRELLKQRSKFIKAHASSGYKHAIAEMLGNPDIQSQLGDVKSADEVRALNHFYEVLSDDVDKACYGFKEVSYAASNLAISELLIADSLYRAADPVVRQRFSNLALNMLAVLSWQIIPGLLRLLDFHWLRWKTSLPLMGPRRKLKRRMNFGNFLKSKEILILKVLLMKIFSIVFMALG